MGLLQIFCNHPFKELSDLVIIIIIRCFILLGFIIVHVCILL